MKKYRRCLFLLVCLVSVVSWFYFIDVIQEKPNGSGVITSRYFKDLDEQSRNVTYKQRTITYSQQNSRLKLLLYSAIAINSTDKSTWDKVIVQGWSTPASVNYGRKFECCVLYKSGALKRYKKIHWSRWTKHDRVQFGALQFYCDTEDSRVEGIPIKVMIRERRRFRGSVCLETYEDYLDVEFAYKQAGIAAFIKILYSQLSHNDMLSWFEIHRKLGIDKVFGYVTDDLNNKARLVLGHYQRLGVFEPLSYPLPGKVSVMYQDTIECWNYQGVSNYDSQTRLQGFDYLLSIDSDEYIIPARNNESLKSVFDRLFKANPDAAGLTFRTFIMIKDWGVQANSPFSVEKYLNRSEALHDRIKHVIKPKRVQIGSMHAHSFKVNHGFERYEASTSDVAIYHYRSCRPIWEESKPGYCLQMDRFKDTRVMDLFQAAKSNVERIKAINNL